MPYVMGRTSWWIPVLHLAWFVLQADTERSGESAAQGTQIPHVVTFDAGETAVLFCSVSNLGDRTVTWRKLPDRNPLTIGTKTWIKDPRIHAEHVPNSSQWNLVIEKVKVVDSGTYECQVSARGSQFRQQVNLQIKWIEISGRNYIKQGETIHLQCNATMVDNSFDNLEWLKDGLPLAERVESSRLKVFTSMALSPQLTGSISSSLEIKHSRVSDGGEYVCRSTDRLRLVGVKVEVKQDAVNSKRAENIQQYKGTAGGQAVSPCPRVIVLTALVLVTAGWRTCTR